MTIKGVGGCLLGFLAFCAIFAREKTNAVTYSYDVDVNFTFNSVLSVSLSASNINLLDLVPGTSSVSNAVDISIGTNNAFGYTLKANVGSAENASRNMTHTNNVNTFTGIAVNANQASLTTDNTWGYSTSVDSGSTWSNYSGLPLYTAADSKTIVSKNAPSSDVVKFRVGAKAASSQLAGDYSNKITFIIVSNIDPGDVP